MILATHPADCFNCKKKGSCELHEYCREYGIVKVVTGLEIRGRSPDASHPFFNYDKNKCILCGRCVGICRELQCSHVLEFSMRGGGAQVVADFDHCARLCHASTVTGLAKTMGSGAMTGSISDVDEAELFLRLRPGSNVALYNGMAAVIITAGIYYAMGVTQHSIGTDGVVALTNLALLAGQVGQPGTGVHPLRGQNDVQGACDSGCLPDVLPGYRAGKAFVEISPVTAAHYGIADGQGLVRLRSRRGAIEVMPRISERVADGVVFVPFHFAEAAANILTNAEALDPEAKIPEYKVSTVRLEQIE